jgi:hypothetical protein
MSLAALAIFSVLGTVWVDYMFMERQRTGVDVRKTQARAYANAGIQAAFGELRSAVNAGSIPQGELSFDLPLYFQGRSGALDSRTDQNDQTLTAKVVVNIADESGKINVNHAPPRVLQAVLGVDGQTARAIRSQISPFAGKRGLTSVRELETRDLLSNEQFTNLNTNDLTVYSVANLDSPAYLNVNAAPPAVLVAALGVPVNTAENLAKMAAENPFTDVGSLSTAAGKTPTQFNFRSESDGALPPSLSFTSRCYRIRSHASMPTPSGSLLRSVEAVVIVQEDGEVVIQYWNESASSTSVDTESETDAA